MTFTIAFAWWWIPAIITFLSIFWALFIVKDSPGLFSGIGNIFALVPALFVSMVAWIIAAILK